MGGTTLSPIFPTDPLDVPPSLNPERISMSSSIALTSAEDNSVPGRSMTEEDPREETVRSSSISTPELITAAKKHRQFLLDLHRLGVSVRPVNRETLRRYRCCWLPLLRKHCLAEGAATPNHSLGRDVSSAAATDAPLLLIPPPDIAWVWHCDKLSPADYLKRSFSKPDGDNEEPVVYGAVAFEFQTREHRHEPTIAAWSRMMPQEPFFIETSEWSCREPCNETPAAADPSQEKVDHDLEEACTIQSKFLYQLSLPQYEDDAFLEGAVDRYVNFLKLQALASDDTDKEPFAVIPTVSIDYIWHTHMALDPQQYMRDCQTLRQGRSVLIHEHGTHADTDLTHDSDEASDRVHIGSPTNSNNILTNTAHYRSWLATLRLWNETYPGNEFVVEGDYFRGDPPESYYNDYSNWNLTGDEDALGLEQNHAAKTSEEWATISTASHAHYSTRRSPFISASFQHGSKIEKSELAKYPPRSGYMFGMGPSGIGYYLLEPTLDHDGSGGRFFSSKNGIECKNPCLPDALIIMSHRIKHRQQELENNLRGLDCRYCVCGLLNCFPKGPRRQREDLEQHIRSLSVMRRTLLQVLRNEVDQSSRDSHIRQPSPQSLSASAPSSQLGSPRLGKDGESRNSSTRSKTSNAIWMDPTYLAAAACGGLTMVKESDGRGAGCGDADCCDDCCYF